MCDFCTEHGDGKKWYSGIFSGVKWLGRRIGDLWKGVTGILNGITDFFYDHPAVFGVLCLALIMLGPVAFPALIAVGGTAAIIGLAVTTFIVVDCVATTMMRRDMSGEGVPILDMIPVVRDLPFGMMTFSWITFPFALFIDYQMSKQMREMRKEERLKKMQEERVRQGMELPPDPPPQPVDGTTPTPPTGDGRPRNPADITTPPTPIDGDDDEV